MNVHDFDHTITNHYNDQAKQLEAHLDSDVICYVGQIHPFYFKRFRNFIEDVKEKSERTNGALTVLLGTPGGSVETTERMVDVVRKHYSTINFIVPDAAMSAGTIFCMSGDKIFMDYTSSLGPIDPQVLASDNSGYVAALGYLDKVQELSAKDNLMPADVVFLKSLDLARLALFEQAKDLSVDLLKKWLVQYKFKDWTHHRTTEAGAAVTEEEKQTRAEEIAKALADNNRWHSHGRALGVEKLAALRLEIEDYSEDKELRAYIRNYYDVLTAHMERARIDFFVHSHLTDNA